ncbi:MAG: hypothetical protein MJK10_01535 [Pseudomonadales bacterium]|nr:hypothetical protein [Pseudomonadales bacterium]NRA14551.1 hypothetical protein [Oceanospirillaceae bacterium]
MRFKEHGVFEIKTEDKLLLVDGTGPFNEELIEHYSDALESCIHHLETSQWDQILTLHQLSLYTPEAEDLLTKNIIKRKSRGLKFCSIIISDVDFKSLVKEQISRCYTRAGIEHHFFDSMSEAKESLTRFASRQPLTDFC